MDRPRLFASDAAGRIFQSVRIAFTIEIPRSLRGQKWAVVRSWRRRTASGRLQQTSDVSVQTGASLANSATQRGGVSDEGGDVQHAFHPLKISRVTLSSPLFANSHIANARKASRIVSPSLQPSIGKGEVYVSVARPVISSDSEKECKPLYPTSRYQRACSKTMPARKPLPRDYRRRTPRSPVASRRHRELLREARHSQNECRGSWYSEQSPMVLATFPFFMEDNRHLSLKANPAWWYRQDESSPSTPNTEDSESLTDLKYKRPIARRRVVSQARSPTSWRDSWARLKTPKLDPRFSLAELSKELGLLKLAT